MSASRLPPSLVPPEVDLRDMQIPLESFARMTVDERGISYDEALAFVNESADRVEGRRSRQVHRAERRAQRKAQLS